jgi:Cupin-like domain
VPLELTRTDETGTETFERFNGPLRLFLDWMRQQQGRRESRSTSVKPPSPPRLYLAQCPISDLPAQLLADLPTPDLVLRAGKGDIYDANIWMGTPPTYTPLHRDPNPNFFLQLAGAKVVRLFPPEVGRDIFASVQKKLGRRGSTVFRGEEMMQGEEREMLEREVWEHEQQSSESSSDMARDGHETTVEEGHALFIPLGWWHSIKSIGTGTTASVNWWFR